MDNESSVNKPKMLSRKSPKVLEYLKKVEKAKRDAAVVTLREWYDSIADHSMEIIEYIAEFKQLGRLSKELHNRGVNRVTERFGDNVGTL